MSASPEGCSAIDVACTGSLTYATQHDLRRRRTSCGAEGGLSLLRRARIDRHEACKGRAKEISI
ncbi:hypothetical protein [Sorangium sp. So ce542]|uniref:hypothetical protein n=1 Tax=Sorangium sp. So ce542 TaxID=3133316 RepID=UPI003F5F81B1